jgi:hypothetical protein
MLYINGHGCTAYTTYITRLCTYRNPCRRYVASNRGSSIKRIFYLPGWKVTFQLPGFGLLSIPLYLPPAPQVYLRMLPHEQEELAPESNVRWSHLIVSRTRPHR